MKHTLIFIFILLSVVAYGQSKHNYVHFNKLIEVKDSEYVVATIENRGKLNPDNEKHLLFINTITGETNQVNFPKDAYINEITQVRIDSLGIHKIIIPARTVDLDGRKGIEWDDPMQIIVLSIDGKDYKQLTDDNFFVRTWIINKNTGRIVILGNYDTNNNKKYDKADKPEILIFDLKTLEAIAGQTVFDANN